MIAKTPLESWIKLKIGIDQDTCLTRSDLEAYQLKRLKSMLGRVQEKSLYYKKQLTGFKPQDIHTLEDLRSLPFTTRDDLRLKPNEFACVSQNQIKRVMTVETSGTTGQPKRFFFTQDDQERTTDFFQHGMAVFTRPGDRVLILLPGERPGSVGDLLQKGLARMGALGVQHGPVYDPKQTLKTIKEENINVLVSTPSQMLLLVRFSDSIVWRNKSVRDILLSTDYVPQAIVREIRHKWGSRVFNHYGMTETGLGGGVQCEALEGYHLREADFLWEIIDSEILKAVQDGEYGEIVVTSLTTEGTPLIRYRTGDISRFLLKPCPCGTILKTMDIVSKRVDGKLKLKNGSYIWQSELDEVLFSLPFVLDFKVTLTNSKVEDAGVHDTERDHLYLTFNLNQEYTPNLHKMIMDALDKIQAINLSRAMGSLRVIITIQSEKILWGKSKRTIADHRGYTS